MEELSLFLSNSIRKGHKFLSETKFAGASQGTSNRIAFCSSTESYLLLQSWCPVEAAEAAGGESPQSQCSLGTGHTERPPPGDLDLGECHSSGSSPRLHDLRNSIIKSQNLLVTWINVANEGLENKPERKFTNFKQLTLTGWAHFPLEALLLRKSSYPKFWVNMNSESEPVVAPASPGKRQAGLPLFRLPWSFNLHRGTHSPT